MQSMPKMKLSCHDQLDQVQFMTKIRKDNDVFDHIGLVYVEIEIELSRPIWQGVVYDENKIEQ